MQSQFESLLILCRVGAGMSLTTQSRPKGTYPSSGEMTLRVLFRLCRKLSAMYLVLEGHLLSSSMCRVVECLNPRTFICSSYLSDYRDGREYDVCLTAGRIEYVCFR